MAHCPCGRVGVDCQQAGYVLGGDTVVVSFSTPLDQPCSQDNAVGCYINGDAVASCVCKPGFQGALCDERIQLDTTILVTTGFGIPLFIAAFCVFRLRNRIALAWKFPATRLVQGRASAKTVLYYRVCTTVLLFAFIVFASRPKEGFRVGFAYRFLSGQNTLLAFMYFVTGVVLSRRARRDSDDVPLNHHLQGLERFHFTVFSIVYPLGVYIFMLIWSVFFPLTFDTGDFDFFTIDSMVMHVAVPAAVSIDYSLASQSMYLPFANVLVLAGCAYTLCHSVIMTVEAALDLPHRASYEFLRLDKLYAPVVYVGIAVIAWIDYYLLYRLDRMRSSRSNSEDSGADKEPCSPQPETEEAQV